MKQRSSIVWLVLTKDAVKSKRSSKQINQLAILFDIVIRDVPSTTRNLTIESKVANFVLDNYEPSKPPLSFNDFNFRRQLKVKMGPESRQLIKEYFMAARSKKQYTFSGLQTVARFARAHARLMLRTLVEIPGTLVFFLPP